jgi:hypothetical protein
MRQQITFIIATIIQNHLYVSFMLWYLFSALTLWHVRSVHSEWADAEQLPHSIAHRAGMFKWLKMIATLNSDLRKKAPAWMLFLSCLFGWFFLADILYHLIFHSKGVKN